MLLRSTWDGLEVETVLIGSNLEDDVTPLEITEASDIFKNPADPAENKNSWAENQAFMHLQGCNTLLNSP